MAKLGERLLLVTCGLLSICIVMLCLAPEHFTHYRVWHRAFPPCNTCHVYDMSQNVSNEPIECVPMRFEPPADICIYPVERDIYVSSSLKNDGYWEKESVELFQSWLTEDSSLGVIDLGANVGVFSLIAAKMGHQVLSVEPNEETIRRFHKSVVLNKVQEKVTLLKNVISSVRSVAQLEPDEDNQGATRFRMREINGLWSDDEQTDTTNNTYAIVGDDLAGFCNFNKAVMKIDIEGGEGPLFYTARALFDTIDIRKILLEWYWMVQNKDISKHDTYILLYFLSERGFRPQNIQGQPLNIDTWEDWPDDVVWVKD